MQKDETKEKILSAAKDVFSRKGFTRATTKDIANAANVAEVTVFRRFENKNNLYHQTIMNYLVAPMLDNPKTYEEDNGNEEILAIVEERINTLRVNKDLFISAISEAHYNDEVKNIIQKIYSKVLEVLSLSIEYEQKGSDDADVKRIAQTILLTIVGGIIFESLGADQDFNDTNELLEAIKSMIYKNNI